MGAIWSVGGGPHYPSIGCPFFEAPHRTLPLQQPATSLEAGQPSKGRGVSLAPAGWHLSSLIQLLPKVVQAAQIQIATIQPKKLKPTFAEVKPNFRSAGKAAAFDSGGNGCAQLEREPLLRGFACPKHIVIHSGKTPETRLKLLVFGE